MARGNTIQSDARPAKVAPPGVSRCGLSRYDAAFLLGISTGTFNQMVSDGRMPPPRIIGSRRVWVKSEVEQALSDLPADEGSQPAAARQNTGWGDAK